MKTKTIRLLLTILGVGGIWGTAALAVKCSKKADLKESKKEKIFAYAPAIAAGVGTSACVICSHRLSSKEIAALTATCGYLTMNRDKIQKKIKEKFGEETLAEVNQEVAKEELKESKGKEQKNKCDFGQTIEETGNGNQLFLDMYLGRKFRSSLESVEKAIKQLNYDLHCGDYVCMNDFYRYLGIRPTRAGDQFGWPANEDYYDYNLETPIEFEIDDCEDDDTHEKMYAIDIRYGFRPTEWWMEV